MHDTWFISDTHFGHKNILEYEKESRPFDTLDEMHEAIIQNWNNVVRPQDVVYHLGDFAFGAKNIAIAARLNGRKRLILGNHDIYDCRLYLEYFDKVLGALHWKRCVLTHIPIHPDNLGQRFWLNIHGHLHSRVVETVTNSIFDKVDPDLNYFNVSCEQNNLTPIHSDEIMQRLEII